MSRTKSLIYYAFLGDEDAEADLVVRRLAFMERQLQWLADLIERTDDAIEVLVPYVAPRSCDADVRRAVEGHGFRIDPASVQADRRNTFEYRGFSAMKTLATTCHPESLIYYCHSKGIVHLEENKMGLFRMHTTIGLTADLARLIASPDLTRAGLFPYKFGWCWYNFFWIKAGYMSGLTVREADDRYQFEALIGDRGDKDGYRGVLALIDQVPVEDTGVPVKAWYRPEETTTPTLTRSYDRYAALRSPTIGVVGGQRCGGVIGALGAR